MKDEIKIVLIGVVLGIYLLSAYAIAIGNATSLATTCNSNHKHWQANPFTLGATGVCE